MSPKERARRLIDHCHQHLSEYLASASANTEPRYLFLDAIADAIREAVTAEREACAALCEDQAAQVEASDYRKLASTIRARAQVE